MKFLRIIAFPLSLLYGSITWLRNKLYDWGIFSSSAFPVSTITVGNLSVGGTGKTPHIEYLVRLLKNEFKVATLSRGYGRKSKGFVLSDSRSTADLIGDEPLQFKTKFSEIPVAVDEKRVNGIKQLSKNAPTPDVILLDDAFQHRAVKPGLTIVLSDYSNLYFNDCVLPSGTLREFRSGIKRADIIIVTKCPEQLPPEGRTLILKKINPLSHQKVFFSFLKYGSITSFNETTKTISIDKNSAIVLFTGIANPLPLENYLTKTADTVVPVKFADHYSYTENDLLSIQKIFNNIASANKILLTTEKDAMRLKSPEFSAIIKTMPLFYIPIEIDFQETHKKEFNQLVLNYVRTNQQYSSVH